MGFKGAVGLVLLLGFFSACEKKPTKAYCYSKDFGSGVKSQHCQRTRAACLESRGIDKGVSDYMALRTATGERDYHPAVYSDCKPASAAWCWTRTHAKHDSIESCFPTDTLCFEDMGSAVAAETGWVKGNCNPL